MNKRAIKKRRAAERRRRQRVRQKARERRATHPLPDRPNWWHDGLEETLTEEIVVTLAGLGIQIDEARFREQALAHKTVDALAEAWFAQSTATGIWEDYPWLAARALWPRWVPDLFSVDVFIAQHLPAEAFGTSDEPMTREDAERHWRMARAVMDLVAPKTGLVRPELLEELSEHASLHVGWWLSDLPSSLAQLGMVDQAAEICARMAAVEDGDTYLGDRAMILAEAGRREAALQQVEEILARFPDDPWVRLTAGDVHEALGDLAAAEATYRHPSDPPPWSGSWTCCKRLGARPSSLPYSNPGNLVMSHSGISIEAWRSWRCGGYPLSLNRHLARA